MAIKVGDPLPEGTVTEFIETEQPGCTIGPNAFQVTDLTRGKKIVVFGLPGALTPTRSAKHVPGYVANYDKLKAKGVDEIWCLSVNDARSSWALGPRTRKPAAKCA
jgi:peroxiredoxin